MRKLAFITTSLFCILGSAAQAEWFVKVDPPDVFGNKTVMAADNGYDDGLIVQCDKTNLKFAYIVKKKEFQEITEANADFLVQIDGGTPTKISAILSSWNDNFAGVISDGKSPDVVGVLRSIAGAKQRINVGAIVNGNKLTASFDAVGSTNAMTTVLKECGLNDEAKPAQSEQ